MTALEEAWASKLVAASGAAPARPGLDARVAVTVAGEQPTVLDIRHGRVADVVEPGTEVEVEVPLTAEQLAALVAGELSLAVAYMRGDVKPVGSSGALAVLIEVVEDPATWAGLRP